MNTRNTNQNAQQQPKNGLVKSFAEDAARYVENANKMQNDAVNHHRLALIGFPSKAVFAASEARYARENPEVLCAFAQVAYAASSHEMLKAAVALLSAITFQLTEADGGNGKSREETRNEAV